MGDRELIHGIENAQEEAINHAINKYAKLMWHIVSAVLKNVAGPEDIEECVADVFVYLWQNHGKYNKQRSSLKTWLSLVAKSKAIDRYRKLAKRDAFSLHDEIAAQNLSPVDDIVQNETKREFLGAINSLARLDREIMVRRYYYEQKPKEIGLILNMPVKQVENRLYRSKLKLRNIIGKEGVGLHEKE